MNLSSNRINQNTPRNQRQAPRRNTSNTNSRPQVQQANTLSNYGTTTKIRSLYPGQIIKGEVSDLRNTEVVVTLEDNTTVAGKLENGNWLAIGETAAFKITSASQENIVLEAMPRTDMSLANSTIQKALEEAGLPKNEKNQQIVLELMNNQLPIHKQGIQQMLQLSFQHKDINIPTLVLLNKLKLPITSENATQLELYQQKQHALSNQLQDLSQKLSSLVQEAAQNQSNGGTIPNSYIMAQTENIDSTQTLGGNINISETHTPNELTPESQNTIQTERANPSQTNITSERTPLGTESDATLSPGNFFKSQFANNFVQTAQTNSLQATASHILSAVLDNKLDANTIIKNILPDTTLQLSENEKQELFSILDNFDFSEAQKEAINTDTASLRDIIHLIHKDFEEAFMLDKATILEDVNPISDANNALANVENKTTNVTSNAATNNEFQSIPELKNFDLSQLDTNSNDMLRISLFDQPVIQSIERQFSNLQIASNELGGKLTNLERIQFSNCINTLPVDESVKEKVSNGEITGSELLRTIKNVLPFTEQEAAIDVLSSDAFTKILKEEFLHSFLLSPSDLLKEGGVDKFYHNLSKQLDELDDLLNNQLLNKQNMLTDQLTRDLQSSAKESVGQAKNNMDFMKLINQFFSYVQLPVNLKEECTHADLYVYTKKKTLEKRNNPIHVLLHLDMEHLGNTDIDITLKDQTIKAQFAMNDEKSAKLVSANFSLLEDTLLEKGYLCNCNIVPKDKDVDIVKDFMEPEGSSQNISRYSFDLRA